MKKKNKITKETFFKRNNSIEKEVIEIFNEITEEKKLSIYRLELFAKKIELLKMNLQNNKEDLDIYNKKIIQKTKIYSYTSFLSLLLGIFICPINYTISLLMPIVYIYLSIKERIYELAQLLPKEEQEFNEKIKSINNTIISCNNFINAKIKKFDMPTKPISENLNDELLANHVIDTFLKTCKIPDMSERTYLYLINLLQEELITPETDLTILLEWVREDMNKVNDKLVLSRQAKKNKNSK